MPGATEHFFVSEVFERLFIVVEQSLVGYLTPTSHSVFGSFSPHVLLNDFICRSFEPPSTNPHFIEIAAAGGFNDPVGFLAMLRPLLGEDFKNYLGTSLGEKLTSAEIHSEVKIF